MAGSDRFEVENCKVIEALKGGDFRVEMPNGNICICNLSGKMRMNFIRIVPGDLVTVDISAYDLNRGRIIYREK